MTNQADIAAELERLEANARFSSRGEPHIAVSAFISNHHAEILAALRAAGEVGELRKVAAKILAKLDHPNASVTQWDADELRRAIAGSET